MKHQVKPLIQELDQIILDQLSYLDSKIIPLTDEELHWRPAKYKWTILEVVEHLNRFGVFYLPRLKDVLHTPKALASKDTYNSGFIAEKALKRVRPVNGVVLNKSKSLSKYNPFLRQLDRSVLEEHKEQQVQVREILEGCGFLDLSKNRISTMIHPYIRLNYGDSLRTLIYHAERHYVQIDNLVHKRTDL